MTQPTPEQDAGPGAGQRAALRLRDPRVWLGLFVTVVAMWFALRGVDLSLVLAEFARADLFVLPSLNEGLGLVLVEAMAKRLPVVATSVGGVPEVVDSGSTGMLVPSGAPEKLAEAIGELADHPEMREEMGRNGYERALARFSIQATVRATEDLYRQLVEDKA